MNRRQFLCSAGAASAGLAWPLVSRLRGGEPAPAGWRTFEVTTRVEVLQPHGLTRVWLPVPLTVETPYQKPLGNVFEAAGGQARLAVEPGRGTGMVVAEWPAGVKPVLSLTSTVSTRDHAVALSRPAPTAARTDRASVARYLEPTALLPTDGIVKQTAKAVTRGAATDLDKARALYEWIVDNTFRNPKTRGCGRGDIRVMLESKDLGGKCADLNGLFVGLARAAGLPARDAYGLRLAKSELGYKSLGAASENVTRSQHCRAEVFLAGRGWVPVDPADVRKVALEEPPGNLALSDEKVRQARARLFGSWEMNWMAYNFAHDVALPGSKEGPIPFFMYPQGETDEGRLDSLDPDGFKYGITVREIGRNVGQ